MSTDLDQILNAIRSSTPHLATTRLITIDGPAGSGKTTLAAELSTHLNNAPVIHMDDLYDGWYQDLQQDLAARICAQILDPIRSGSSAKYERYDWFAHEFVEWIHVPIHDFLILEGVGSGHPMIRESASTTVWIEVEENVAIQRVIYRDGEAMRPHIVGWHERESDFFAEHDVKASADFRLLGE